MAGTSNGHPPAQLSDLQPLLSRIAFLRQNPSQQRTPNELETLVKYIANLAQLHGRAKSQIALNGNDATSITSGSIPTTTPSQSTTPTSFTEEQISTLRAQIYAFKCLSRGMPIPDAVKTVIHPSNKISNDLENQGKPVDIKAKVVDSVVHIHKGMGDGAEKTELESLYPYTPSRQPFSLLMRNTDSDPLLLSTRLQRNLLPNGMPQGLSAQELLAERDHFVEARIEQRIKELEDMSSTMGEGGLEAPFSEYESETQEGTQDGIWDQRLISPNTHGKLRALIELKALRVRDTQKKVRAVIAERLTHGLLIPLNRPDLKKSRPQPVRDVRTTEQLERKQRVDRERRAKSKHVEQLNTICSHGKDVIAANRNAKERIARLGRNVASFHVQAEKDEQKRVERISKERLKALKADDEEAYMRLIDTAKDTRITHLLRQTDAYLDSLAQAVVEQQNEGGLMAHDGFDVEEGPASEATFGAQVAEDDEAQQSNAKVDYYAVAHRISEKITKQPSILVGGTLKDYQIKGLQWMISLYNNKLNGILADEMGLGKTIQTISLITFLIESKKQRGPYLVIVPLSTMTNWSGEFAKWAPSVKVIAYKGNPAQRRALQSELRTGQFQVILTTYEYIIKDRPHLSKIKWVHMIIDEGHRMKNTQSKLSQTLTQYYHTRYRLILTGTPLQNNLPELWSLLNFVLPRVFNSVKSFDEWFNTPFANSGTSDKIELNEEEALLIIRRLHKVLRPFLLRRLKRDVESELPDKVEKVIKVRMSALQSQLYRHMKKYKMIANGGKIDGKSGGVKGLSNELMQLRKICQHPFLFDSVEDNINPSTTINDKLIRASGKIELLSRLLPKFFAADHRVLIFFQMTKVMDIMEDFLKMMGWKYLRLDGGTKTEDRAAYVQLFNAKDSEFKVFILSTRAGGLGLNLQTADTVVIFDSDWNPHADLQAQDRAHRIGQTKAVLILRFITEKSVEEAMYSRARYKLDIDDKVIQAGRFDNKSTQEEQEEFLRSILEADQDEDNEEAGDMNDEEINAMIKRSDDEEVLFRQMDIEREARLAEQWRLSGGNGATPPPLMSLEELPDAYQTDDVFEVKNLEEVIEGRGQRRRTAVVYNDGLSDDAWAMALEEGGDLDELQQKARDKRERLAANKLLREAESVPQTPASLSDAGTPTQAPVKGRRGRKPKVKVADSAATSKEASPAALGKRKRGKASTSETPPTKDEEVVDSLNPRKPKRSRTKQDVVPDATSASYKRAFTECLRAVIECNESGRRRSDLFMDLPDKKLYPTYYVTIPSPISINMIKKRVNSGYYKSPDAFRAEFKVLFNNARLFNQEGSFVYVDSQEMEAVFDAAFDQYLGRGRMADSGSSAPTPSPYAVQQYEDGDYGSSDEE